MTKFAAKLCQRKLYIPGFWAAYSRKFVTYAVITRLPFYQKSSSNVPKTALQALFT